MKITSLTIKNFKSFLDQKLDKLSNITMIYGHNNSGKSNLLKFIDIIFSRKYPTDTSMKIDTSRRNDIYFEDDERERNGNFWEGIIEDQPFLFHKNQTFEPIEFAVTFLLDETLLKTISYFDELKAEYFVNKEDISIEIIGQINYVGVNSSQISLVALKLEEKLIFSLENSYFESASDGSVNLKSEGFKVVADILSLFNDSVLFLDNDRYFVGEKSEFIEGELLPKTFKNWFHNISLNTERYEQFVDIIKQISKFKANGDDEFTKNEMNSPIQDGLIFEFGIINNDIEVLLKNSLASRLPLNHYGTGIQQILFILAKIAEKRPKIILLEEIELNLSPKYQVELIQHVLHNLITNTKENRKFFQLIFTSHSPLLCFREDFIVYKISINEKGETQAKRVKEEERKTIKQFYPEAVITELIKSA